MKEYFYKKEYKFLYLSKFFYALGNAFVQIFGVVMLYKNGMPLSLILLIYGIQFGIMGLCSPLFIKIASHHGIAICALIANILRVLGTFMILTGQYNNLVVFILILSIPGALSNPIEDAISTQYVDKKHRGKYNSLRNIARILGQALASLLVTWGVITNNHNILMLVVSMCFLLDYLFTACVDYKPKESQKSILKDALVFNKGENNCLKTIYALRTNHIIERLFLPLYLYLAVSDFATFSMITIISLLLQIVTVIFIGRFTDKNIKKTNHLVTTIKLIITTIFLITKNRMTVAFTKTVSDNFEKMYETSIQSSIQNIIDESQEDSSRLSTIGQMSLCFTEVIVFSLLALISLGIQENIFFCIFGLSILSTITIDRLLVKDKKKER